MPIHRDDPDPSFDELQVVEHTRGGGLHLYGPDPSPDRGFARPDPADLALDADPSSARWDEHFPSEDPRRLTLRLYGARLRRHLLRDERSLAEDADLSWVYRDLYRARLDRRIDAINADLTARGERHRPVRREDIRLDALDLDTPRWRLHADGTWERVGVGGDYAHDPAPARDEDWPWDRFGPEPDDLDDPLAADRRYVAWLGERGRAIDGDLADPSDGKRGPLD